MELLGGFNIAGSDGLRIDLSGRKSKALLAMLALSPDMSENRERLAGVLWSDRGNEQARGSLRQVLAGLKRDLGPASDILEVERNRVGLLSDRLTVDAVEFQKLARMGRARDAITFCKGELLEGISVQDQLFEDWLSRERRRLNELAIELHEARAAEGPARERITAARRLLDLDPLREASHRALMEAFSVAGERDKALRQFEQCRSMLRVEFGVEPSAQTRELHDRIANERNPAAVVQNELHGVPTSSDGESTTVAVLPLANLSSDDEGQMFADGITEDLISELARYRHLTVIGHRLSSHYRDRRSDLTGLRQALGVDFIVEGSVRLAGQRARVVVNLIDVQNGAHVWGDRFDREIHDIFAVQDEIVGAVIARLAFNLDEAAERQQRRDLTLSSSAYAWFLRARTNWRNGEEKLARECAEKAVEIDPSYGRAHAYVGYFYAYSLFSQWIGLDETETIGRSAGAIEKALSIDRSDPFILQRAAMTHLMLGDPDTALRCADAAAKVSASDSEILVIRGLVLTCCGRHDEGVGMLERAVMLEPRLSPGCSCALSEGRHVRRDYEGGIAALEAIVDPPYYVKLIHAVNLARLGRVEEARQVVKEAPSGFDVKRFARSEARMCALAQDSEHWLQSFRLAGVDV